jgi:hypothetical protein
MATPLRPARDIIEVINPLDVKRYVPSTLDEGKITARVSDLWKIDQPTLLDDHMTYDLSLIS